MVIPEFHQFGGRHTEVSALKNTLEYLGAVAPHTGRPFSEPMLFGLGGGLGFVYFLFERAGTHPVHIGTRIHTKETEQPEFFGRIASRIGAPMQLQNSSSATAAATNLKRHLSQGTPPIVSVDALRLPYLGLNSGIYTYYSVAVFGLDEEQDKVMLSDRCAEPLTVTRDEFRQARSSSWSPKYRSVAFRKPGQEPDIRTGVTDAIRECAAQMNGSIGITNFGLRGMEKWATVLTSSKEKKSWPKIFSPGPTLYEALFSVYAQISTRSDTGHAHRAFYADFLDEAADLLETSALRDVAGMYRRADEEWRDVAEAHLPSEVPLFKEAKELAMRRRRLFETEGPGALTAVTEVRNRLAEIEKQAGENFPLSFQDSRTLLNDLRQRVLRLRDTEAEAVRALEAAVPSTVPIA